MPDRFRAAHTRLRARPWARSVAPAATAAGVVFLSCLFVRAASPAAAAQRTVSAIAAAAVQLPAQSAPDSSFRHSQHRDVDCTVCHSMTETHGRVTVTGITDCRSCHHTAPVMAPCTRCHSGSGPAGRYGERRTLSFSVGRPMSRTLPFEHVPHARIACGQCHTGGLTLSAATASCDGCHAEHHEPDADCMSCHREPPDDAHDANAHVTCTGAGCHTPPPLQPIARTRPVCLTCHQDLVDHRPGRNCVNCHALPAPRGTGDAPDTP